MSLNHHQERREFLDRVSPHSYHANGSRVLQQGLPTLRERPGLVLAIGLIFSGLLAGCSGGGGTSSTTPAVASTPVVASPPPDSVTVKYVALVHDYWINYVTARADGANVCLNAVDPPKCRERAAAILAIHEKFLRDLDTTPPPPKFAVDDQAFRSQLPKAIADIKAMISAAESGDKQAVILATQAYVNDMIPTVTNALDHVDPSATHG